MTPDQFIAQYQPPCFYHFTDLRNLPSIEQHGGLYALAKLRAGEVAVPAPGGNQWSHDADTRYGLDQYVHLCLIDDHPMEFCARKEGRIGESVYLRISSTVLSFEGIRFTADVSNKTGVGLMTLDEAVKALDLEVVYSRTDWRDRAIQERRRAAKKYELLVPSFIPLAIITK